MEGRKITVDMKKCLIGFIMGAAVFAASAGEPVVEFAELSHDFGTIQEDGGPVSHEFLFSNTGDAPLMVVNATASCGCTRPEYPKKPVKAGKQDKIKVTYLPAGRPGEFNKTVTIRTNAKKGKKVTLKIKGFVNPKK